MRHPKPKPRSGVSIAQFLGPAVRIAWGRKPSAKKVESEARAAGDVVVFTEDGFIRSLRPGPSEPAFSVCFDRIGIYYDATAASELERLVDHADHLFAASDAGPQKAQVDALMRLWRSSRVSKYNHAREAAPPNEPYVLVADQTDGDLSIRYGHADRMSFLRMLDAAFQENPGKTVLLKVHPEVAGGRKKGHFDLRSLSGRPRLRIVAADAHPVSLIENADVVYAVTSQIGFEALMWEKPVRVFGMPFYAGWGLTEDELPPPPRRRKVSLEALVHAALVDYCRYADPETGEACDAQRLIEWMGLQRRCLEGLPERVTAVGFSRWKRGHLRRFAPGSSIRFAKGRPKERETQSVLVWGMRGGEISGGQQVVRVEDGFIRSAGLGCDLTAPSSWVFDPDGIYYDATRPSRLERLLEAGIHDERLLERAASLREAICRTGVSKYNLRGESWIRPSNARRVLLVPGQVEGDASILYGALEIRSDLALLRAVRHANPDAFIVYKPHPDVLAGARRGGRDMNECKSIADEIVGRVDITKMFPQVDELHTMTSLSGFEALLRGRSVHCYGMPFYAGWGLTNDIEISARRTRRLTLDELVAGALILYPTYSSPFSGFFTTPERLVEELAAAPAIEASFRTRLIRRMVRLAEAFRG
jgi:capsular polysaccharide export protein